MLRNHSDKEAECGCKNINSLARADMMTHLITRVTR